MFRSWRSYSSETINTIVLRLPVSLPQKIAELEAQLERQDVRGTALRAAIAKLEDYAGGANQKAEEADKDLLSLDRELTILQANVSTS